MKKAYLGIFAFLLFQISFSFCKKKEVTCTEEIENPYYWMYNDLQLKYFYNQYLPDSKVFQPACQTNLVDFLEKVKSFAPKKEGKSLDQITQIWEQTSIAVRSSVGLVLAFKENPNQVVVAYVEPGSSASTNEIKRGMVLESIDGRAAWDFSPAELQEALITTGKTYKFQGQEQGITLENALYTSTNLLHQSINSENKITYLNLIKLGRNLEKNTIYRILKNAEEKNHKIILDLRYARGTGNKDLIFFLANSLIHKSYIPTTFAIQNYNAKFGTRNLQTSYGSVNQIGNDYTSDINFSNLEIAVIVSPQTGVLGAILIDLLAGFFDNNQLHLIGEKPIFENKDFFFGAITNYNAKYGNFTYLSHYYSNKKGNYNVALSSSGSSEVEIKDWEKDDLFVEARDKLLGKKISIENRENKSKIKILFPEDTQTPLNEQEID